MSKLFYARSLNLGVAEVAQAEVKWVESLNGFCPTVCQQTDYKFAVPGGINPRATKARGSESVYYVCATLFSGWRIGFNIDYQQDRCYTGFRSSEHYGELYHGDCTDQEMPPVKDNKGYIKRKRYNY
ncbi:MAG: hypothetical protein DRR08_15710 [Candidatus Parabeggiatoa sp. nov. 2]|nr:MAG: hypothetical protein DRR08_15710 [Gammaproteobacteria bacterium]